MTLAKNRLVIVLTIVLLLAAGVLLGYALRPAPPKPVTRAPIALVVETYQMGSLAFRVNKNDFAEPLERALVLYAAAGLLSSSILTNDSATKALESWCKAHNLAPDPTVRAERGPLPAKPPNADQLKTLQVTNPADVKYRYVRLRCGDVLLSEAENWYVHTRLTSEMNRTLDTTDTAFGTVVRPLNPTRRTLGSVQWPWKVLPVDWDNDTLLDLRAYTTENKDQAGHDPDRDLFQHQAVLTADVS